MKEFYSLLFPIPSFSLSPFSVQRQENLNFLSKFYGTMCPISTSQERKSLALLPSESHYCESGKTEAPLSSFQNIVCSCSSGMPHILRLLPRTKNRAQAIRPVQPRSLFFKVAPFQTKWALCMYPFSNQGLVLPTRLWVPWGQKLCLVYLYS